MTHSKHVQSKLAQETMMSEIQGRLDMLKAKTYEVVKTLPEWASEDITVNGVAAELTTYRQGEPPEPLRIVVQFSTKPRRLFGLLRSRQVIAAGFSIYPDGRVENLEREVISYFC